MLRKALLAAALLAPLGCGDGPKELAPVTDEARLKAEADKHRASMPGTYDAKPAAK